eukprot:CAMPEP_0194516566 /NCGR_PEP_ID=MMETSP0253-20130528/49473_1 /TAXON_ID=2966 /ORGANISM="Noctiluca scintillans" /LENGTH=723 /DNA_ID=CAMNT_0039360429 /DNA_START=28 /DNA_END=2199 /DNA_ORIENTATION=-
MSQTSSFQSSLQNTSQTTSTNVSTSGGMFILERQPTSNVDLTIMTQQVSQLTQDKADLTAALEKLRVEWAQAQTESIRFQRQFTDLSDVLKQILAEGNAEAVAIFKRGMEAHEKVEHAEKRRKIMSLEAMLSEKDITKATNEALKERHNNEISHQRQELAHETNVKQSLEHQLAKAHATINSLQKALDILQAEWTKKTHAFAKQDDRVSQISAEIESLSGLEAHLVRDGDEKTKTIHKLQDEVNYGNATIARKESELGDKSAEIKRLLQLEPHFELMKSQLVEEVADLKKQVAALNFDKTHLLQMVEKKDAELTEIIVQLQKRDATIEGLNGEVFQFKRTVDELNKSLSTAQAATVLKSAEVAKLREELSSKAVEIENKVSEITSLTSTIAEKDKLNFHHKQTITEVTVKFEQHDSALTEAKAQVLRLTSRCEELSQKLKVREADLAGKDLEVERLHGVIATLNCEQVQLGKQVAHLHTETQKLHVKLKQAEAVTHSVVPVVHGVDQKLSLEVAQLSSQISTHTSTLKALEEKHRDTVARYEARIAVLQGYEKTLLKYESLELKLKGLEYGGVVVNDDRIKALDELLAVERQRVQLHLEEVRSKTSRIEELERELARSQMGERSKVAQLGSLHADLTVKSGDLKAKTQHIENLERSQHHKESIERHSAVESLEAPSFRTSASFSSASVSVSTTGALPATDGMFNMLDRDGDGFGMSSKGGVAA